MAVTGDVGIWPMCTAGLGQFSFIGAHIKRCPRCDNGINMPFNIRLPTFKETVVDIAELSDSVDLAELVQYYFDGQKLAHFCPKCSHQSRFELRRVLSSEPPLRMAIALNRLFQSAKHHEENANSQNTPESLTINYFCEGNATARKAKYKWLGGIYLNDDHYCVYWDDGPAGNPPDLSRNEAVGQKMVPPRPVYMYDGKTLAGPMGIILGSIVSKDPTTRIPWEWQQ
ncbi:MAG: hypothetical protein M1829_002099 [Trizodia sp. TS-e1964]|nr:MAG: hypothetical protein M1829_002099 [Trizodia sp. TS-e1964]